MFVSAAVSEICELNQNKEKRKNSEIDNTFPGHIHCKNLRVVLTLLWIISVACSGASIIPSV